MKIPVMYLGVFFWYIEVQCYFYCIRELYQVSPLCSELNVNFFECSLLFCCALLPNPRFVGICSLCRWYLDPGSRDMFWILKTIFVVMRFVEVYHVSFI
jgi:hypothetical protein